MFKEVKTPSSNKWINRSDKINSFTMNVILFQLINIQIGVRKLVNTINGSEISSTAKWRLPQLLDS
jgi:hypothetical protein